MSSPRAARPSIAAPTRLLVIALALAAAYWLADLLLVRPGPPHPLNDVWEDALVARSLLAGHGFRTTMIYPPLWGLRDPLTGTVPVLVHGPLLPLLFAALFRLFGSSCLDHVAWLGALAAWLTALFTGRIATRLVTPTAGVAAVAFVTLAPLTLDAVHHSQSVMIGALAVALALDALVRDRPRALLAGLALGMGYLVRPELLLVAPLLVLGARPSWIAAARAAGAFVLCALPWWAHHARVLGAPMFNLTSYTLIAFTPAHPGHSPMQDFALSPQRWPAVLRAEWPAVLAKLPANLPGALRAVARVPSLATSWLVLLGGAVWLADARRRAPALAAIAAGMVPVAMMMLTYPGRLYVVPLLPVYVLAAAIGSAWFAELRPWRGRVPAWPVLAALVVLASALPALRTAHADGGRVRALLAAERAGLAAAGSRTGPGVPPVPIFSDRPDFTAWTTGRPVLWVTPQQYDALYPRGGAAPARTAGLPPGRDPALTWFHDEGYWPPGHRALP